MPLSAPVTAYGPKPVASLCDEPWEYSCVHLGRYNMDEKTKEMNLLGAQGWECFQADANSGWYYFKRKKPAAAPASQVESTIPMNGIKPQTNKPGRPRKDSQL